MTAVNTALNGCLNASGGKLLRVWSGSQPAFPIRADAFLGIEAQRLPSFLSHPLPAAEHLAREPSALEPDVVLVGL